MGFAPRSYEKIAPLRKFIEILASLISSVYFKSFMTSISSNGLGYSDFEMGLGNKLVSGYFQTYRWAQDGSVFQKLKTMEILAPGPQLTYFVNLAKIEKPLIVHVRLGDYKSEYDFGILSANYYFGAIEKVPREEYKKIWLFSDETESALEFIPEYLRTDIRIIGDVDNSAASSLELMRYGHAYVIGNSTFSWWAAFLSYKSNATVVAPKPWFKNIPSPRDLIPQNWTTFSAF
jgi:hypothetical protein